jgi:hypothetical protein
MIHERIRLAILAFWLGIMCFFSFVVAPVAFKVLPASRLAGEVVSVSLAITEMVGMGLGLLLIVLIGWQKWRGEGGIRPGERLEAGLVVAMTLAMAGSRFFVSSRLHAIRLEYGDRLALLAADDPVKSSFDLLHRVSVWLMGLAMIGALSAMIRLISAERRPQG